MNTVKRGDTNDITLTIKDDNNEPVDLTGATVKVIANPVGGGSAETLAPTVLGSDPGTVVHTLTGNLAAGTYQVEVEVTKDGVITTAPTTGYATLIVEADLG